MFSFAKKLKDKLEGGAGTESDSYFHTHLTRNNGGHGLRILYVKPGSKAQDLELESWFDYIVGVNGHSLPMKHSHHTGPSYSIGEDGLFNYGENVTVSAEASMVDFDLLAQEFAMVAQGPDKTVFFEVWSAKGGILRHVSFPLVPIVSKSAETPQNTSQIFHLYENVFEELGITVSSQHLNTATHVWRILNTHLHSPAFQAQLAPYVDYIIGCDSAFPTDVEGKGILVGGGEQLLAKSLSEYYTRHYETLQDDRIPVVLYVYNHDFDTVRPVTVYLSRAWNPGHNKGILGCDVGYGFLHRLPEVPGKFVPSTELVGSVPVNVAAPVLEKPFVYQEPKSEPIPVSLPQTIPVKLPVKSKTSSRYAPVAKPEVPDLGVEENTDAKELVESSEVVETLDSKSDEIETNLEKSVALGNKTGEPGLVEKSENQNLDSLEQVILQNEDQNVTNSPLQNLEQLESNLEEDKTRVEEVKLPVSASTTNTGQSEVSTGFKTEGTEKIPYNDELNLEELTIEEDHTTNEITPVKNQPDVETEHPSVIDNEVSPSFKEEVPASSISQDPNTSIPQGPNTSIPQVPVQSHLLDSMAEIAKENEPIVLETENHTLKPEGLSKIDSLLDEDEDFLDQTDEALTEISEPVVPPQPPKVTEDTTMCEIPLTDLAPPSKPPVLASPLSPPRISQPLKSAASPVFSPMRPGLPLSPPTAPPIPKVGGRRRKAHGPANLGSLADFMNEELSKSKENDRNYNAPSTESGTEGVPPPPPKIVKR